MKSLYLLFVLIIGTARADIDYYFGDTMVYQQDGQRLKEPLPKNQLPIPPKAGTVSFNQSGIAPTKIGIKITSSDITLPDSGTFIVLKDDDFRKFKDGRLVKLPSGDSVQYFQGVLKSDQLIRYNKDGLIASVSFLIKKRTDQDTPANP